MSQPANAAVDDLRQSLSSMQQLRKSAIVSMVLMAVGLAVLIGGILYTNKRLRPLEQRVAALKAQADSLHEEVDSLEFQAIKLSGEDLRARTVVDSSLTAAQRQLDSIRTTLVRLSATNLNNAARAEVSTALERSEQAENTVTRAGERLDEATLSRPRADVQTLIAQLFDERASVRVRAYDALMTQHASAPGLIPTLVAYADAHPDNHDGVFNTVIVLNTVPQFQLAAHRELVTAFLDRAEGIGSNTRRRVAEVRRRIPPA